MPTRSVAGMVLATYGIRMPTRSVAGMVLATYGDSRAYAAKQPWYVLGPPISTLQFATKTLDLLQSVALRRDHVLRLLHR
jgi:hypothetical protein